MIIFYFYRVSEMKVGGELFYCFSMALFSVEFLIWSKKKIKKNKADTVQYTHHQRTQQEK